MPHLFQKISHVFSALTSFVANRQAIIGGPTRHLPNEHATGETLKGRKFVYCPPGNIFSWSEGDYDNGWCHWCKKYLSEIVEHE